MTRAIHSDVTKHLIGIMLSLSIVLGVGCNEQSRDIPTPPSIKIKERSTAPTNDKDSPTDALKRILEACCNILGAKQARNSNEVLLQLAGPTATDDLSKLRRQVRSAILSDFEKIENLDQIPRDLLLQVLRLTTQPPSWYGETLSQNLQARAHFALLIKAIDHPSYFVHQLSQDGLTYIESHQLETKTSIQDLNATIVSDIGPVEGRLKNKLSFREPPILNDKASWSLPTIRSDATATPKLELQQLSFRLIDKNGKEHPLSLTGIQSAGPVDIVWGISNWHGFGTRVVCVMREPGKLEPIFETDNQSSFCSACYDGKFVWLPLRGRNSRILLIDPKSSEVMVVKKNLKRLNGSPKGIALEPGKVLWIDFFGRLEGRSVYLLKTDASDLTTVKLEYLLLGSPLEDPGPHRKPANQLFGSPVSLLPLYNDDGSIMQVVIGYWKSGNVLLDLHSHQASKLVSRMPAYADNSTHYRGSLYWSTTNRLWRLGPEDLDSRDPIASVPEEGCVCFDDNGRIYLFGKSVWSAANVFARFEPVDCQLPERLKRHLSSFLQSSHYGNVLKVNSAGNWKCFQITFHSNP